MIERKTFPLEIKGEVEEDGHFTGHAAVFNNVDLGNDKILPGAFKKTLKEKKKWPLLLDHRTSQPVGGFGAEEDLKGLAIDAKLTLEVQRAREARALMKDEVLRGLSIGYEAIKYHFEGDVRVIKEIKLYEVSLVVFPMNIEAQVDSIKMEYKPRENEHSVILKDPGLFNPDTFQRKSDGTIDVILAKLKEHDGPEDEPQPQSMTFPTKDWTIEAAKKWLEDRKVKYERFKPAEKSLQGVLGRIIGLDTKAQKLTKEDSEMVTKAIEVLCSLCLAKEPEPSTQDQAKPTNSLFSSVIEGLKETGRSKPDNVHLFQSTIEALKNSNKETS